MKKYIFIISVMSIYSLFSQDVGISTPSILPTIIPSPPDVLSFDKYGDIPIGYYTGTPNISIPLHKIVTKSGLEIPLTLSYHASGIKVDEKASRTGLGWSLNSSGIISKRIIGTPDFGQNYPNPFSFDPKYNLDGNSDNEDYFYALGVAREGRGYNEYDSGFDIFSYNFLGRSGKFFVDNNNDVHLIPHNNLKIIKNALNDYVVIIDDKGNEFHFQQLISTALDSSCRLTQPSPPWTYSQLNTGVLLSKIVTPLGEEVLFNYTNFNYSYIVSIDEIDYNVSNTFNNSGCPLKSKKECIITSNHGEPVLSSITFKNQIINLIYSDDANYAINGENIRKDFPGNHALRKIEVQYGDNVVKDIEFKYDYFTALGNSASSDPSDFFRLKLTEVVENDVKIHKFYYNESISLPPRLSYAQDKWGFYNGLGYGTLLPEMYYGNEKFSGAKREVNPLYTQANMLTKIEYPTKGYSEFIYENNTYFAANGETVISAKNIFFPDGQFAVPFANNHAFSIGESFTNKKLQISNDCDNGFMDSGDPQGLPSEGENGLCFVKIIDSSGEVVWNNYLTNTYDLNFLGPGDYTLEYRLTGDCLCSANFAYDIEERTPPGNVDTAGLRILKINNFDGQNNEDFSYEYNKMNSLESSGILQGDPDMFSIQEIPHMVDEYATCKYLVRNSSSIYPIALAQGNSVGYSNVTEYKGDKTQYGRTEFGFTNFGSGYPTGFFNTLITPQPDFTWKKGLLLEKTVYNRENDTVFKETNEYQFDNHFASNSSDYLYDNKLAVGFSIRLIKDEIQKGFTFDRAVFDWNYYFIESDWVKLIKTEKTSYFSTIPLITTTDYFYDNPDHIELTRTEIVNSARNKIINKTYFPYNGIDIGMTSDVIDKLITQHQIAQPLQWETYIDLNDNGETEANELLNTQRINFKEWSTDIILPEIKQTAKGEISEANPLENSIVYNYYPNGNVKEISKESGAHILYIWGYNEQYPIAKIENATFDQIPTMVYDSLMSASNSDINNTTENTLRTELAKLRNVEYCPDLSNAMVTTFTYDPLIGVTSMTDTKGYTVYYEYDGFNRLEYVKDHEGNILSENEYHYRGQM